MNHHAMGNRKEGHKFIGKKDSSGMHHTMGYRSSDIRKPNTGIHSNDIPSMSDGIINQSNSNANEWMPKKGMFKPVSNKPFVVEKQHKKDKEEDFYN